MAVFLLGIIAGVVTTLVGGYLWWLVQKYLDRPMLKMTATMQIQQDVNATRLILRVHVLNDGGSRIVLRNGGYYIGKSDSAANVLKSIERIGIDGVARRPDGDIVLEAKGTHEFIFDPVTQKDAQSIGEMGFAYVVDTNGKCHYTMFHCGTVLDRVKEILTPDTELFKRIKRQPETFKIPGGIFTTVK